MWHFNHSQYSICIGEYTCDAFQVLSFSSTACGIARHYYFYVKLLSKITLENLADCLQKPSYLSWLGEKGTQYLHGYVADLEFLGKQNDGKYQYILRVASPLINLVRSQRDRVFVNETPKDIIHQVLEENGFLATQYKIMIPDYDVLDNPRESFIAQFNQTDWWFILRLMRRFGWYCYWKQTDIQAVLVICHQESQLPNQTTTVELDNFSEYQYKIQMLMDHYQFKEYNENAPNLDLTVESQNETSLVALGRQDIYGMHYRTLEEGKHRIQHAQEALDATREIIYVRTICRSLVAGQLLLIQDGVKKNLYRILQICHQGDNDPENPKKARYENFLTLIPAERPIRLPMDLIYRPAINLFVEAKVFSDHQEGVPDLDNQGRYKIQFNFDSTQKIVPHIRLVTPYAGKKNQHSYGFHYPLRHGTSIIVGFINGDLDRPIIIGAMSDENAKNPVKADNSTQHRIRTFAGNELLFDDNESHRYIQLQTARQEQRLHFNSTANEHDIQLANQTGKMNFYAKGDFIKKTKSDSHLLVGGDHHVNVFDTQNIKTQGNIDFDVKKDTHFHAAEDLRIATQQEDLIFKAEKKYRIATQQDVQLAAHKGNVALNTANSDVLFTAKSMSMLAPQIQLGCLQAEGGNLNFGGMAFNVSSIDCYYPIPAAPLESTNSENPGAQQKENTPKKSSIHIPPLMVISLYDQDAGTSPYHQYFTPPTETDQFFKKDYISADEIAYFKSQGNNATLFIHGFNVGYGKLRDLFKVNANQENNFNESIFSRNDLYRDEDQLRFYFPEIYWDDVVCAEPYEGLNGTDAHAWWLCMEWNLNQASRQFDEENYSSYTRLLHVAWQGKPTCSLDYMAAVLQAKAAGKKLAPLILQLKDAGINVNIIAHSLGNCVVLQAMELLASSYENIINQFFMWQPALGSNAFSVDFPHAIAAAKKVTIFYSEHDNVLGEVQKFYELDLFSKSQQDGLSTAGVVLGLEAIDKIIAAEDALTVIEKHHIPEPNFFGNGIISRGIRSIYLLANLINCPLTDLLNDSKANAYYKNFVNNYHYIKYQNGQSDLKEFPETIRGLEEFIIDLCAASFFALTTLLIILVEKPHGFSLKKIEAEDKSGISVWKKLKERVFISQNPSYYVNAIFDKKNIDFENFNALMKKLLEKVSLESLLKKQAREIKVAYPKQAQAAAIVLALLISSKPDPVSAMGYRGINKDDPVLKSGKIFLVNQQDWLFSHSGMKNPGEALMKNVYIKKIFDDPSYEFGKYKEKKT
jgi:type VI secretion system secreted protein VgrG